MNKTPFVNDENVRADRKKENRFVALTHRAALGQITSLIINLAISN
jgi:hypothetical protein